MGEILVWGFGCYAMRGDAMMTTALQICDLFFIRWLLIRTLDNWLDFLADILSCWLIMCSPIVHCLHSSASSCSCNLVITRATNPILGMFRVPCRYLSDGDLHCDVRLLLLLPADHQFLLVYSIFVVRLKVRSGSLRIRNSRYLFVSFQSLLGRKTWQMRVSEWGGKGRPHLHTSFFRVLSAVAC
jgi:hypothetical protein